MTISKSELDCFLKVVVPTEDYEWKFSMTLTDVYGGSCYECRHEGSHYMIPYEHYDENKSKEENIEESKKQAILRELRK
jgi:hypothetical protein